MALWREVVHDIDETPGHVRQGICRVMSADTCEVRGGGPIGAISGMANVSDGDKQAADGPLAMVARGGATPPVPSPSHWRWRTLLVAAAGLAAFAAIGLMSRAREVTTAVAKRGSAAEVVYATGNVEPVHWAKVTALSRKRIVEICKCEGKQVKKGDVLARLDDAEEAAVMSELQARLARLKDDAERLTTLVQRNITPKRDLDEKLTQIREQEARIAAQQDRIADLSLKSPMDGVVLRRDGEIGEMAGIGSSDTLLWVGQPTPLQIVAEVNEDDISRVTKGQKTLLRHEGHTQGPLTGEVMRITPKGDPQAKTFRVYIALPDDTPLRIGMTVEANIVVSEITDGVIVPAEAVSEQKVQTVDNGRVTTRPVEVGIRGSGTIEIRSALKAGDVVVSPFDKTLKDGALVRPVEAKRK